MATTAIYKTKKQGTQSYPGMLEASAEVPKVNLNQVTILPRSEWERITDQLSEEPMAEKIAKANLAHREKVENESRKLVSTWTNTIAGARARKLQAKKLRDEKEEEDRKLLDIEEEKYQAERRKEVLDEAKKLQYWKTDRVKTLHSALTLTAVLRERDEQLKLRQRIKSAEANADAKYVTRAEAELNAFIENERVKTLERCKQNEDNRQYLVKQIGKKQLDKDREKIRDRMEGIEIQDALRQYNDEMVRVQKVKDEEKRQLLKAHGETLANKTLLEAIQRQNEEEADDRIRRFALAKREMAKLKAKREHDLLNEKIRIRDEQTEKLGLILRQKKSDEEDRVFNALKEKEEKDAKDDAEKMKQQMEMFESINKHRLDTEKLREEKEKREKLENLEMRQARIMADQLFQEEEEKKQRERFEHEKALKQIHLAQTKERKEKEEKAKEETLKVDHRNNELLRLEAQQFTKYVKEVITEEKERGAKNLYPLVKVANDGFGGGHGPIFDGDGNLRPSYKSADRYGNEMPNYQAPACVETKVGQTANTAKRLGFVWKT